MPRHLIKGYSGCFCDGALGEVDIELDRLSKADCPLQMQVGNSQREGYEQRNKQPFP